VETKPKRSDNKVLEGSSKGPITQPSEERDETVDKKWFEVLGQALRKQLTDLNDKLNAGKFLSLGLDRGTHALRYVLADPSNKKILKWGCLEFGGKKAPSKVSKVDPGSFPGLLAAVSKTIPKKGLKSIHINVQESSVMMGRFQIPKTGKAQQPDLLRMALKDQLSYPVDQAAYYCREYSKISERLEHETGGEAEIPKSTFHYAAAPKRIVSDLVNSVENAFEIVPTVDLQGYAHENLIRHLDLSEEDETIAFLNVGRSTTVISIFQNQKLVFERNIPLAGQDITRSILITYLQGTEARTAEDLGVAEKLKRKCAIPYSGSEKETLSKKSEEKLAAEENQLLFQSMESVLTAWVQDIRLSFGFFNEHYSGGGISKVYLMGGTANLKNLSGYLAQELEIGTELLHFPENGSLQIDSGADAEKFKEQFHEYATSLALALEPDGHMGLTPKEYQRGALEQLGVPALRIASFILIGIMAVWVGLISFQIRHSGKVRDVLSKQQQSLFQVERPYLEMLKWQKFLNEVDTVHPKASTILKIISNRIPGNLILSRLTLQRKQGSIVAEGIIYGDAKRRAVTIAEFSKALEETAYFKDVDVPQLIPLKSAKRDGGRFRITAQLVTFD